MKKKENLWELLKRLDEQAGQFDYHLAEANRYFDTASERTRTILIKHEHDLHKTIGKVRRAIKKLAKKRKKKEDKNHSI